MKKSIFFILCALSMLTISCEDDVDLSGIEDEIENLKDDIQKLQSVIALQNAYQTEKEIVSATKVENIEEGNYWLITFTDNTTVQLPESAVKTIEFKEETAEYYIQLSDGQELTFNTKEKIYPTGLVSLTQEVRYMKNTEVSIEFRVNPSNAIFNYDVTSTDCQIALDMVEKMNTYSYVTKPERCRITHIEPSKDAAGNVKEGQYRVYIRDNGGSSSYKYATSLVLSTQDKNGDAIQLSSSAIIIERKKDTQLPVVVIQTENEREIVDKENWIPASMTIDGIGKFDDYKGTMTIRGRGNSTWTYPKKPYNIKLDSKSEILGMPKHKRWCFLANYMDRTAMRNHIAFEISKRTGLDWTPRGQFVEVVLNEEHIGNYYMCEHIKIDKNRVNVTEMDDSDVEGDAVTGGYLLEIDDYFDEVNKFRSAVFDYPVMFKEPDEDVLQPQQFAYMQNYIDSLERELTMDNFVEKGSYLSMIDISSFIDFWFVYELTYNYEPNAPRSCFFHKDRLGPLKAGPVWDFDGWGTYTKQSTFCIKDALWYGQLFKDPSFVKKVKERWALLKPSLEEVADVISETGDYIAESSYLNEEMWNRNNYESWSGDETLLFMDAVLKMKESYLYRLNWLDNQIQNM